MSTTPSTATQLQAEAIAAAIQAAIGERPSIIYRDDTAEILFNAAQAKNVRGYLERLLRAQAGAVKVSFLPVLLPLVIKKTWPYAAAATAVLLAIGYIAGKSKQ